MVGSSLRRGIIAHYNFKEVSGTAIDSMGNYHMTNNGTVTYGPLHINNGADGGASNTTKYLSNSSDFGIGAGNMGIAFWVKNRTEISSAFYGYFAIGDAGTQIIYSVLYDYNGGARRLWFVRRKNGSGDGSSYYTVTMGTADKFFITMSYDGTNLTGSVNGVAITPVATSGNGASGVVDGTYILAFHDSASAQQYSSAIIGPMTFWNRPLTREEELYLYNGGRGRKFPFWGLNVNTFGSLLRDAISSNAFTQLLSETVTNTDLILKDTARTITETVTNSDTFVAIKIYLMELLETVTNLDTIFKDTARSIIESVTNNDTITKLTDKIISETSTITDTITQMQVKILTLYENLTILEDFRMFLNSRVARWRDKYNESKTQDWVEKQDL